MNDDNSVENTQPIMQAIEPRNKRKQKERRGEIEDVKPCPFCGSNQIGGRSVYSHAHGLTFFVMFCQSCRAQTGMAKEISNAMEKWNARKEWQ